MCVHIYSRNHTLFHLFVTIVKILAIKVIKENLSDFRNQYYIFLTFRLGIFDKNKPSLDMASPTNVVLGTFMLWWGWLGFNCGSTFGVSGGK